ncbi:A disintegrin and metalloproteinase with thrombospondin motifs adt-1 isoform X2 [Contarinia nasturtii]|uniref:A disintegrin and metalloproteinase with thrombospondin motifs adt-1 isoform X2 n=1 Tax=Contarinia nasturtii TaxID=265458 RepID=UPI0012D41B7B|nr:A disintegrin and metalloproteinase with thrombospondin motifs adt-1 isoform X2 [Contarinia nasturtii]
MTIGTHLLIVLIALENFKLTIAYHISVEPQATLKYNGHIIDTENLHTFLDNHEKQLLFGINHHIQKKPYKLVNVKHKLRNQRSVRDIIHLQLNSGDDALDTNHNRSNRSNCVHGIDLHLHRSTKLLDDNFVFIKRDENQTQLIDDFDKLAEKYSNCFYRNENSAIDLCDGNVRGILYQNSRNLIIHPLPTRFGSSSHILYETELAAGKFDEDRLQDDIKSKLSKQIESKDAMHLERRRRYITSGSNRKIPHVLFVETAIFVDRDLFRHMVKNYPKNTEGNLIRFVMAMINGVQLLYHHPSLGHQINFILKRLEILHNDPKELRRSSDIDIFLNSFCMWQRKFNPVADDNIFHFDHAVILTGLDLYVVSKNGKISSQVVGLAPVAGMCTSTSSCTINEGKHFESVFVVAHEIGHNLGMRHDTAENNCDPSLFIMSPTLGSGKITWSKCSQNYLKSFLETSQAKCLFDHGQTDPTLDHGAEMIYPGERFDADQQCMLKYGKDSIRSRAQPLKEICRDLHCQRDRYTWTSHPALEGTSCAESKWCRSGVCIAKTSAFEKYTAIAKPLASETSEKSNLIDDRKFSNFMKSEHSINRPTLISTWSEWSKPTECESGCLFGETGRLREGSSGLKTFRRTCHDYRWSRKKCFGLDKRYETCFSKQCYNVPRTSVLDFANQICERAKKFDSSILGEGLQVVSDNPEHSCRVYCAGKNGKPVTKSWTFPDGTICKNQNFDIDDSFFCVNGRCEKFSCNNSTSNYFTLDPSFCVQNIVNAKLTKNTTSSEPVTENGRDFKNVDKMRPSAASLVQRYTRNDPELPKPLRTPNNFPKSKLNRIRSNALRLNRGELHNQTTFSADDWIVKSGCHFSCLENSMGIQIISSKSDHSTNIQLCNAEFISCDKIETTQEFATNLCKKYQRKVRGLSGNGMQIAPSSIDPDRGCKVACQDEYLSHRFYLVNGDQGFFPYGTKCSRDAASDNRYCVNGKCLQFDQRNIPLVESHISLALYRSRRSSTQSNDAQNNGRSKRNFLFFEPVNITERLSKELLQNIVNNLVITMTPVQDEHLNEHQLDLINPIHISFDDIHNLNNKLS